MSPSNCYGKPNLLLIPKEILIIILQHVYLYRGSDVPVQDMYEPRYYTDEERTHGEAARRTIRDVRLTCKLLAEQSLEACAILAQKSLPNQFSVVPIRLTRDGIDRLEALSHHRIYKKVVQQLYFLPRDEDVDFVGSHTFTWDQDFLEPQLYATGHIFESLPGYMTAIFLDDELRQNFLSIVDANVPTSQDLQEERNNLVTESIFYNRWHASAPRDSSTRVYTDENGRQQEVRVPNVTYRDLRYFTISNIIQDAFKVVNEVCESPISACPLLISWVCERRRYHMGVETLCLFPNHVQRLQASLSRLPYFGSLSAGGFHLRRQSSECIFGSVLSWLLSNISKAKMALHAELLKRGEAIASKKMVLEALFADAMFISYHPDFFGGILHSCRGLKRLEVRVDWDFRDYDVFVPRHSDQLPHTLESLVLRCPNLQTGGEEQGIEWLSFEAPVVHSLLPNGASNQILRHLQLVQVVCDQSRLQAVLSCIRSLRVVEIDCVVFAGHHPVLIRRRHLDPNHKQKYLHLWVDTLDVLQDGEIEDASLVDLNYDADEHSSSWILDVPQDERSKKLVESVVTDDLGRRNFKWYIINPAMYKGPRMSELTLWSCS